jgi:site-specific recombinase XerD
MPASKISPPALPLSDLLQSWILVLKAENKAKSTVYNYGNHVKRYITWCEQRGQVPRIDRALVNEWTAEQLADEIEPVTVKMRQLALRRLSAWMDAESDIDYTDQLLGLRSPKLPEKLVTPLTDIQLKVLLAACEGTGLRDIRDMAILRLMTETGMRAGEVIGLHVADLDLPTRTVTIRKSKTGRGRTVNFSPKTGVAIDKYLRRRRNHVLADRPQLWLGEREKGLSYMGLRYSILARAELAGIKGFHLHRLRHTAASRWLTAGGSEQGLMQRAGWRSRQMLDRYTRYTAEERAAAEADRLNLGDL